MLACGWRLRRGSHGPLARTLLLEVGEHTSQKHDHALALGPRRRAPLLIARALVRDLELEAGHRRCVVVRGLFRRVLMGEDVPVVLGTYRYTRSFRRASRPSLRDRVADLP